MKLYFNSEELKHIRARLYEHERSMNESLKTNPNAKNGAIRDSIEESLALNSKLLSYVNSAIPENE